MNAICANAEPTKAATAKSDFMYMMDEVMVVLEVEEGLEVGIAGVLMLSPFAAAPPYILP